MPRKYVKKAFRNQPTPAKETRMETQTPEKLPPFGLLDPEPPPKKSFKMERIPLSDYRNPLLLKHQEPGYQYRIFNSGPGWEDRVERAKLAGWEPVIDPDSWKESTLARGTSLGAAAARPMGGGVEGILMKIKDEWFEADAAKREERCKHIEKSLNGAAVENPYGKGTEVNTSLGQFHDK